MQGTKDTRGNEKDVTNGYRVQCVIIALARMFTNIFAVMFKRFVLYALRWQLSTPILAPVLIYCSGLFSSDPNINFWIATVLANFVGSCIFFWVDKFIFRPKTKNPLWEVKDNTLCFVCGKTSRCYRLFRAKNYDRTDDKNPIFLCEECSRKKVEELKERGVSIP